MPELIYINFKGMEMDKYVYEFLFSETPEIVYGPWWGYPNPSICGNIAPALLRSSGNADGQPADSDDVSEAPEPAKPRRLRHCL